MKPRTVLRGARGTPLSEGGGAASVFGDQQGAEQRCVAGASEGLAHGAIERTAGDGVGTVTRARQACDSDSLVVPPPPDEEPPLPDIEAPRATQGAKAKAKAKAQST